MIKSNHHKPLTATAALCGALLLSLTSCSTLNDHYAKKGTTDTATTKKKKSHKDVLPEDRQQFIMDRVAKKYTPEELLEGVIKGDWAIEEVNGHRVVEYMEAPYLKFSPTNKQVYANNGCNYMNGSYTYSPQDKTLKFGDMISTMRECAGVESTATEINMALAATRSYSWELRDSQFYLFLEDAAGERVLTLMHQDFAFLSGTWLVKAIDDQPVDIPDLRFVIDVEENKIHGRTGCNLLNGTLVTDMDAPNSISFQALSITQKLCPDVEFENDLIVALEDAATARPISADKVLLINNHGIVVLELERTTDK